MRRGEIAKGSATALITGAGGGIGRCLAARLAALGYNIVAVGLTGDKLNGLKNELWEKYGIGVISMEMDLAHETAAQELYDKVRSLGIEPDVLINNAGVFSYLDLIETKVERLISIIHLHDTTTTVCCRLFGEDMARRGRGYILNMSSYSLWMPYPGLAVYSASKAYIRSFSKAFAKEIGYRNVKVTTACPAGVATDLYGLSERLKRLGTACGILISADSCARQSLNAMWRGRRCCVPGWWNRIFIPICAAMPMPILKLIRKYTLKYQK